MTRYLIIILLYLVVGGLNASGASKTDRKPQTTQTKKSTRKQSSKGTAQNTRKKRTAEKPKAESSADVKRRQQAAQQEIKKTKAEIAANDKAVKTGLADLGRISSEIADTKKQVADISTQVKGLDSKINSLQLQIVEGEKELSRMREKYLDAVKKMRLKRGNSSSLAFIFSSSSFNQALRRMRYLRQFSEWKDRQSHLISEKVKNLRYQTELLAQTKADKDRALRSQIEAQHNLERKHAEQDAVVAGLKKNGEALRQHLSRKQAEANDLRNRVASLIAQEQAAEEAKRRRQAEQEEKQRRDAEARRREQMQAQSESTTSEKKTDRDRASEAKGKTERPQKERPDKKNTEKKSESKSSGSDYAEARKRRPRKDAQKGSKPTQENTESPAITSKKSSQKSVAYGNFEAAKGNLPRPVSGAFRVTSPFGRHPLPDLPDVMYDNPGIDAQVSHGATAQAVFAGRVSGVYMLPGYNTVVIVSHGNYYTIYGNISSTSVKAGDSVKQGQSLGQLATDPDMPDNSLIHFEVWKNREKLNPMSWIR